MSDPRIAALAKALERTLPMLRDPDRYAAAILAALGGWTLVNEEMLAEALHHYWHTDDAWKSISREEDMANHRRNAAGILAVLRGFRYE